MIDWTNCSAVERDPERESVVWVFRATLVPVAELSENLVDGARLSEFEEWFPRCVAGAGAYCPGARWGLISLKGEPKLRP